MLGVQSEEEESRRERVQWPCETTGGQAGQRSARKLEREKSSERKAYRPSRVLDRECQSQS
jgi:hypothetical protein